MRIVLPLLALVATGLLLRSPQAPARFVQDWRYEKLFRESDLVVLAEATKTEPADAKPPLGNIWPYTLVGQNTTFKVLHTLKGESMKEVAVLHFDFGKLKDGRDEDEGLFNGPRLVAFKSKWTKGDPSGIVVHSPEYLLFLRKTGGHLEPVTGQIDAAYSVRLLSSPTEPPLPWDRPK